MILGEPVRGGYGYFEQPGLFSLPGLDQIRTWQKRVLPPPPIHHLSGLIVTEADVGRATFVMPASPWWQSGAGPFLGGTFGFVADAPLGMAVYTAIPGRLMLATSELSMNFLRPATPASTTLIARATLIQAGRSQGLSEAQVEDASGRLLAHATSRLVVRPLQFDPPPPPGELPPFEPPPQPTPDPYLRPPEGFVVPQEVWNETPGLEVVQGWIKGELAMPPVAHLTGWRGMEVEEGRAVWAMPASEWFGTSWRTFYGGALVLLVDSAINAAFTTTLPPATSYGTLDLKINFLRPVDLDGRDLVVRAAIVHRGRTIAVATADVENADGKRVAIATGSSMYLPGRPWAAAPGPIDELRAPAEAG